MKTTMTHAKRDGIYAPQKTSRTMFSTITTVPAIASRTNQRAYPNIKPRIPIADSFVLTPFGFMVTPSRLNLKLKHPARHEKAPLAAERVFGSNAVSLSGPLGGARLRALTNSPRPERDRWVLGSHLEIWLLPSGIL